MSLPIASSYPLMSVKSIVIDLKISTSVYVSLIPFCVEIFFPQISTYVISLFQESSFGFDIPNVSLYFINFRSSFTSA